MILFRKFHGIIIPLGAAIAALSIGAIIIAILGANPFDGYWALLQGAFGDTDALSDTAVRAMPLLLVGVGICIAFRAEVINIGGGGVKRRGTLIDSHKP